MAKTEKKRSFLTERVTKDLRKFDVESQRKVIEYLLGNCSASVLGKEARSFVDKLSKNIIGQYDYNFASQQTPTPQEYAEPQVEPIMRSSEESEESVSTMPSLEDFDKLEAVEQEEIESMKERLFSDKVISMLKNLDSYSPTFSSNIVNYLLWKKKPRGDPPALTEDESFFLEGLMERPGGQYDFEVSGVMDLKTKAILIEQKSKKKKDWIDFVSDAVAKTLMQKPEDLRESICNFILWKERIKKEHTLPSEDELRFFNSLVKNSEGKYDFPSKNSIIEVPPEQEEKQASPEPKEKGKKYTYENKQGKIYSLIVTKKDLMDMAQKIAEYTKKKMPFDDAKGFVMIPYLSKRIEENNKEMDEADVRLFAAEIMVDILSKD